MKIKAIVEFGDILTALNVEEIPGVDYEYDRPIAFDDARVDDDDALGELDAAGKLPEPDDPDFDTKDLREGFDALRNGDIAVARVLIDRALDDSPKAREAAEIALRDW